MAETPTTRCVECGEPTPDGATYCGRQCRREANRQPDPTPPPRRSRAWYNPRMPWFCIRKAQIDTELRNTFEQYGVVAAQVVLATTNYFVH